MQNMYSVTVEKLTRLFGNFVAVDHITFQVRCGEIFGFLGANGAGKTTTIKMLCGLLMPTSGTAYISGFDIYTQSEAIKKTIGYMSQKFSLYDDLTVHENMAFYAGIYGLNKRQFQRAYDRTVPTMGLAPHLNKPSRDLPVGWKQRLALSCAILHQPQILFLDEPTGGVDPIARRDFWNLIYDLADKGTTVFVTTHYMDEAEYCNRLSIMHEGKIIAIDSPHNLKENHQKVTIEEVFVDLVKSSRQKFTGINHETA
jgi:ABC-2 type transport system ATP-binding protein